MTDPPSKDPAAAWRDLVAQWEKNLNELANRAMGSDEFAKSMNQAVNLSAGMQNSMSDAMGRYLASLNLPSRAEMIDFGERLPLAYRPCKDLVELLQGGVHGLANRPDPFQPEPRLDEIRLDPQPLQRIRLRPIDRDACDTKSGYVHENGKYRISRARPRAVRQAQGGMARHFDVGDRGMPEVADPICRAAIRAW